MDSLFSQLSVLGSSLVLLFGLILLWRRGLPAHVGALAPQSMVLSAVIAIVGYFGNDHELYWVAGTLFLLKGLGIPRLLRRVGRRFGGERGGGRDWGTATR